jgi:Domain of unknown function (DUF4349)
MRRSAQANTILRSPRSGRRGALLVAVSASIITLAGCAGGGTADTSSAPEAGGIAADFADPAAPQLGRDAETSGDSLVKADGDPLTAVGDSTTLNRDVIRTAALRLRADDVEAAALQAAAAARSLGGLVSSEQTVTDPQDADNTVAQLTLRVPAARFDDLLTRVRDLGSVLEQTQQAEDVTGQVADVDARVDAQRASVRRIQALLARAETIGEVVTIEGQLAQRQSDLEALEAQQKALADQTSLATLRVSVVGPAAVVAEEEDTTGFVAGLKRGWAAFTDALTAGLTGLGILVPFLGLALIVGLPLLGWARTRARHSSSASAAQAPTEPPLREHEPVG